MASTLLDPVSRDFGTSRQDVGCGSAASAQGDLPSGFPRHLATESAWYGPDIAQRSSDFILRLSAADVHELETGLEHFKGLALGGDEVTRTTFPLPRLGEKLGRMSRDIYFGRGFGLVRGLDPARYPLEEMTLFYLAIQAYIADQVGRQDKKGNMLVHILADKSTTQKAQHHRHSTTSITFHNEDAGDIVSWLTRSTAAAGGKCIISSGHTVYNALASAHPEMIRTLARSDWPFAMPRFQCRPVIFNVDGRIVINFGRTPLIGSPAHPRPDSLPKLDARQMEALDAIESVAKAAQLEIETQAGDIHFINNLFVLHRREGFTDGSSETQKRHLVRMILRDHEHGWKIPQELDRAWFDAFEKDADRFWHVKPMPEGFYPLRNMPN